MGQSLEGGVRTKPETALWPKLKAHLWLAQRYGPTRKSGGQASKLAFTGHLLMETKNGLVVDARLTLATGTAEPEAVLAMLSERPGEGKKTVGAAAT